MQSSWTLESGSIEVSMSFVEFHDVHKIYKSGEVEVAALSGASSTADLVKLE